MPTCAHGQLQLQLHVHFESKQSRPTSFKGSCAKLLSMAEKWDGRRVFLSCCIDPAWGTLEHLWVSDPRSSFRLGWAGLHSQHGFQVSTGPHRPLVCRTPSPAQCNSGAWRQLPLGAMIAPPAWPCPPYLTAATSSHENILKKEGCFLVRKLSNSSSDDKGELSMDGVASALCTVGKSIRAPSSAVWVWGAQHRKGYTIYLLFVFLILFCLIKAIIKVFIAGPFSLRYRKSPAPSLSLPLLYPFL